MAIVGAKAGPVIGVGRQPMMHMDGGQAASETKPTQEVEQDNRIATTGKPDTEPVIRCQAGSEKIADPARQISWRLLP